MAHRTNSEFVDMLSIDGKVLQIGAAASRLHAERFPNRPTSIPQKFTALVIRARKTGVQQTCRSTDGRPGRDQRILDADKEILNLVEVGPSSSTRQITRQVVI